MKRSDKFRQANREAAATLAAAVAVIIFWYLAGFGLEDAKISIFHTPLWFWTGVVGTWIFATLLVMALTKFVFKDFDLDDEDNGSGKEA